MTVLEKRLWKLSDSTGRFEGPEHVHRLGFCVTCGVVARDCIITLADWTEDLHPRDGEGQFAESGGSGDSADSGGGRSSGGGRTGLGPSGSSGGSGGGTGTKTAGDGGGSGAPTSRTGGGSGVSPQGVSQTAPSTNYGTGPGAPAAQPTPPTATGARPTPVGLPGYSVLPPMVKAKTDLAFRHMKPDEADAFMQGYNDAVAAGYEKEPADFLIEQAALYQHASEGDPRIKTFFYGDTLDRLLKDPDTRGLIDQTVVIQQGSGSKSSGGSKGGSGGGGGGWKDPEAEAAKAAEKQAKAEASEKKKAEAAALKEAKKVEAAAAKEAKDKARAEKAAAKEAERLEKLGLTPPREIKPLSPEVAAKANAAMQSMPPDELKALSDGYDAAVAEGYQGEMADFLMEQAALYQHAEEGDPRLKTFFYGDTLDAMLADPILSRQIWENAAAQKGTAPPGKAGAAGEVEEITKGIVKTMTPDEQLGLATEFVKAQSESGYEGSPLDFFVEQVALFPQALKNDPRFAWLTPALLEKVAANPPLMARAQQIAPSLPKLTPYKKTKMQQLVADAAAKFDLGGAGSGNFGHAGRIGQVGGSAPAERAPDSGGSGGGRSSGTVTRSSYFEEREPIPAPTNSPGYGGGFTSAQRAHAADVITGASAAPNPMQPIMEAVGTNPEAAATLAATETETNKVPVEDVLNALGGNAKAQYAELMALGKEAQVQMTTMLDAVADELGAKRITPDKVDPDDHGAIVMQGPVKGLDRAVKKTVGKDAGNAQNVRDVVRSSVGVDHVNQIDDAITATVEALEAQGGKVLTSDDKFTHPLSNGYRDMNLNVQMPNGAIGEIQIHLKSMLYAKEQLGGHKLYEAERVLKERRKARPLSPAEQAELIEVGAAQNALYGAAWRHGGGK